MDNADNLSPETSYPIPEGGESAAIILLREEPTEIAKYLTGIMLRTMTSRHMCSSKLADQLTALRDHMWDVNGAPEKNKPSNAFTYSQIIQSLKTDEEKQQFMDAFARMGHLYELAGLIARDNTFRNLRERGDSTPGSTTLLAQDAGDIKKAVDALNKPVMEITMTAHPTNVNSFEMIGSLRELGNEIERIRNGEGTSEALYKRIDAFLKAPLTPENEKGETIELTVHNETQQILHYLKNNYNDLSRLYRKFDSPLASRDKGYDPLSLRLNVRFGSWGSSGDKDGNNKVNADTTLEAVAMHKLEILRLYLQDLRSIHYPGPAIKDTIQNFAASIDRLSHSLNTLAEYREAGKTIPPDQFDALSQEIHTTIQDKKGNAIDSKHFTALLEKNYSAARQALPAHAANPAITKKIEEDSARLLNLVRASRTFGFHFAHIEYRETADEYTRVLSTLIPEYRALDENGRVKLLTEMLGDPSKCRHIVQGLKNTIMEKGYGRAFSKDDPWPITYHTIKRMELARDHPDMITDNVLAECTSTSKLLEALFLQVATGTKDKRAELGIIPLFEDPDTMKRVGTLMQNAYKNPAYTAHLASLSTRCGDQTITQQIQIAHSDNSRRSGMPAARALIAKAHRSLRAVATEHGIKTQFFEGGSQSDAYRGGVRALSATINEFSLHDFAKFTFQGGDLLNYFNYAPSMVRVFTRNLVHCARKLGNIALGGKSEEPPPYNAVAEEAACDGLIGTLEDYQKHWFNDEALGRILSETGLGYDRNTKAGNIGSRAGKRGTTTTSVANMRTISFSEGLQHAGLVPTWLGCRNIGTLVKAEVEKTRAFIMNKKPDHRSLEEQKFTDDTETLLKNSNKINPNEASPELLHYLYESSPTFKDVMDRMAFGVAMFDIGTFEHYNPKFAEAHRGLMAQLKEEYNTAGTLAAAAMLGHYPMKSLRTQQYSPDMLMKYMQQHMPNLYETFSHKRNYMEFIQEMVATVRDQPIIKKLERAIHAAGDIVTHGRIPGADDPLYGREKAQQLTDKRNPEGQSPSWAEKSMIPPGLLPGYGMTL